MTDLRQAAQQALEALEKYRKMMFVEAGCRFGEGDAAITNLRAALAQQAEPVAGRAFLERILAAMEGVLDVADRKTDEFDALRSCVIDLTVMLHAAPPQQVAQQAEPLNLSDPAVQKRLATQWGYVPAAAQAEPVEPVAWVNQANLASARLTRDRGGQGDTHTWSETRSNYHGVPLCTVPPQRRPLTEEEIESCRQKGYAHAGLGAPFDFGKAARAVEKASWEKNHGQA